MKYTLLLVNFCFYMGSYCMNEEENKTITKSASDSDMHKKLERKDTPAIKNKHVSTEKQEKYKNREKFLEQSKKNAKKSSSFENWILCYCASCIRPDPEA